MADVPVYELKEPMFIAPHYIKAGVIIEFDGEPGPHMEPRNDAAKSMMERYYKAHPDATLNIADALPLTEGAAARPTLNVIGVAETPEAVPFIDMAQAAESANAPAEKKAATPAPVRVMTLAEAAAESKSGKLV